MFGQRFSIQASNFPAFYEHDQGRPTPSPTPYAIGFHALAGGGVTWYILGWGGGTRPLIRWPSLRQKSLIFPFCLKLNTLFLYQSTLCSEILNGIKILRYLCNNTNTEPRSGEVNIHHFHRHWVNNGFSIYHTSWITSGPKSNFLCDNIPTKAILFLRLKYVLYIKHWTHFSRSSKGLS